MINENFKLLQLSMGKPPNMSALELAQGLIDRIKSGEAVDIAIVEVGSNKRVATAWSAGNSYHLLNSGAARLAARLASEE